MRDRELGDEVEFGTLTFFESMDAVRTFAGEGREEAVVATKARRLLARFDEGSKRFKTLLEPPLR